MTLSSFDIFDTVLIRKCGKAENVFALVAKLLFPEDLERQSTFIRWRLNVHNLIHNVLAPTINDYYYSESNDFPYDEGIRKKALFIELSVESEMLVGNPVSRKKIETARTDGDCIAFVSDMYLPLSFIKDILIRERIFKKGDYLYVSNFCGAHKFDGTLYEIIRKELNPSKWHHMGDNIHSDYYAAKKKQINAERFEVPYTRIEEVLMEDSLSLHNPYELQILLGMSRYVRTSFNDSPEVRFAANYVAPLLIPYVIYVINEAQRQNIKTLFFISRDGYILYKIAESLPHEGINLRFLFASRKSLQLAYLKNANIERFLSILPGKTIRHKNVSEICCILSIPVIDVVIDKISTAEDETLVLNMLFRSDIYNQWQQKAQTSYEETIGYLSQEGVFSDQIGIVDIGWFGSTRLMIDFFRKERGLSDFTTFYWGITNDALPLSCGSFNYYYKSTTQTRWTTFVIENFICACPYPTTIGYNNNGSVYIPIFKDNGEYKDNNITETNVNVVQFLAAQIPFHLISEETLYRWMSSVFTIILTSKDDIDYRPLYEISNDDCFVFRKLTNKEIIGYLFARDYTDNDRACLGLSYNPNIIKFFELIRSCYIKLHQYCNR